MGDFFAVLRFETRRLARRPIPMISLVLMPLLVVAFTAPLYGAVHVDGEAAAGPELAIPGAAAMFAFFVVGTVGFSVFSEHGWGTWVRLRCSPARPLAILAGKVVPILGLSAIQFLVLFGVGVVLLDMNITGPFGALSLVWVVFSVSLVAFGLMCTSLSRDMMQLGIIERLGFLLSAGFGGALVPYELLPDWMQTVGMFMPTYWAVDGMREVIVEGEGLSGVSTNLAVLAGFAAVFTVVTLRRFRFEDRKTGFE